MPSYFQHQRLIKGFLFNFLLILIVATVNFSSAITYGNPVETQLFITPPMYIAKEVGEIFNIGVNISIVENLYSFELTVSFNNSLLNVTNIIPGQFFPQPPKSNFEFEKNDSSGFIRVNMSLIDSETPRSGNGTLVWIKFKVVQGPESCLSSPINLKQTLLFNSEKNPITHNTVSGVFFWKSIQEDPPQEGGLLDLYTQKGGKGLGEPCGTFMAGEMVYLVSQVTYSNFPVQKQLVSFQVLNALNETVLIRTATTNNEGLAIVYFRIPTISSSAGTWKAISVVNIAEEVVWDTIDFQVYFTTPVPVGGYTFSTENHAGEERSAYWIVVIFLAASLTMIRRKMQKSHNHW